MRLAMILAKSENNVIGQDHDMPWRLPDELKRFMRITTGHPIIMGRKTFETFPRLLPNRKHIVITRQQGYAVPKGVAVVHSLEQAIGLCPLEEKVFVIGGAEIYQQAYDQCDELYLTLVHAKLPGDTVLDCINLAHWKLIEQEAFKADERNEFDYTCCVYHRI